MKKVTKKLGAAVTKKLKKDDDDGVRNLLSDATTTILKIVKESGDAFPPLKSALGGICAIIDNVNVMKDNTAETARLIERIDALTKEHVSKWITREDVSDSMKNTLLQLSKNVTGEHVKLMEKAEEGGLKKFFQGARNAADLKDKNDRIKGAFEAFDRALLESIKKETIDIHKSQNIAKIEGFCSKSAPFNAGIEDKQLTRARCTAGTRLSVLKTIDDWIDNGPQQLFWLTGHAGSGKSTIAYTVCEKIAANHPNILLVSYFCSRQLDSGASKHLVPTLCRFLAECDSVYASKLSQTIESSFGSLTVELRTQTRKLLVEPWTSGHSSSTAPIVIVVDALDENDGGSIFLDEVITAISQGKMTGIKFLMTSRSDARIAARCEGLPYCRLQEIPTDEVESDIRMYLDEEFKGCDGGLLDRVAHEAGGLFIYAATIVRIIGREGAVTNQNAMLAEWMNNAASVMDDEDDIPPIRALYLTIIQLWLRDAGNNRTRNSRLAILHTIICANAPIPAPVVADLIDISLMVHAETVTAVVNALHGVLRIAPDGAIYWYHASFQDFVVTKGHSHRETRYDYVCRLNLQNQRLALSCFRIMDSRLRFNICDLGSSYLLDEEVSDLSGRVARCIGLALEYSCRHWASHFLVALEGQGAEGEQPILTLLNELLKWGNEKALFWIEAMNLLKAKRGCYSAVKDVQARLGELSISDELKTTVIAIERLARLFTQSQSSLSTPHLYLSSLATEFATTSVPLQWRRSFPTVPNVNCVGISNHGGAITVIPVGNLVKSIAFSHDGRRVVSGSELNISAGDVDNGERSIHIWDAEIGQELKKLGGNAETAFSAVFSHDDRLVAYGSTDTTVHIWDAETEEEVRKLHGHMKSVFSVAFSHDSKRIVSGSADKTVRIWNMASGEELRKMDAHTDRVNSVAFSRDGRCVVSGSDDRTVRIWDSETGLEIWKMEGHTDEVRSIAISLDGKRIASGSRDKTVRVWDAERGKELRRMDGHTDSVFSVAFSSDGDRVVSGSRDETARIWDVETGQQHKKMDGHAGGVHSVMFLHDGRVVAGSLDNKVRIWDAETNLELKKMDGHTNLVTAIAFSRDGRHIISGSDDRTIRVWDMEIGEQLKRIDSHSSRIVSLSFSHDARILSGSMDETVRHWDADEGVELKRVDGGAYKVSCIAFSSDGVRAVSGSNDGTMYIWDAETGQKIKTMHGHTRGVGAVAFSPDGRHVVSGSNDKNVHVWDAETGEKLSRMEGHTNHVSSVSFSHNGRVASGSTDQTVRIWNAERGLELQKMGGDIGKVNSVAFSHDGEHVVSGSADNAVRIWDVGTGDMLKKMDGHTDIVFSVLFSPDDRHIVSGSFDKTLRIWDARSTAQMLWKTDPTGWLLSKDSTRRRLMWFPSEFLPTLRTPDCIHVISVRGFTTVDFMTANMGEDWSKCYVDPYITTPGDYE